MSFDEVAREALKVAEEIFHEEDTSATPDPPTSLVEDPHLSVEDFLVEEHVNSTSESYAPPKPTLSASAPTQAAPGSARSAPIILDDGK